MAPLLASATELLNTAPLHDDDGNVVVRDGVRRYHSATHLSARPKLMSRNQHGSSSRGTSARSSRSMIGSFLLNSSSHVNNDGGYVCESCDATNDTPGSNSNSECRGLPPLVVAVDGIPENSDSTDARSMTSVTISTSSRLHSNDLIQLTHPPPNDPTAVTTMKQQPVVPLVWTRTTFTVQNVCCASEVPVIRRILRPYKCRSVGVAVTTKRVTLVYNNHGTTTTDELRNALTNGGFPARMVATELLRDNTSNETGGSSIDTTSVSIPNIRKIKASSYVESTISMTTANSTSTTTTSVAGSSSGDRIQEDAALQRIMKQNFSPLSVRAGHVIVRNQQGSYVKIEHNPHRTSITTIVTVLSQSGYANVTVITDGATERLYLPEIKKLSDGSLDDVVVYDDDSDSTSMMMNDDGDGSTNSKTAINNDTNSNRNNNDDDDDTTALRMEFHIILSGLFWAISMLATLAPNGSTWRYLEYTGLLSVLFGLPPVLRKAFHTIRRAQFDANCMMSTAAIGACILGEWDEAASVSFLFSVSDYMEARASSRARRALQAIIQLRPDHASVIDEDTKLVTIVPAAHVPVHALLSVRTGDKIAADGIVVEGTSSVDQSSLTGESMPVQVTVGSIVSGGSINIGTSQLHVRTTASVQDSAVSRLIRLVEDAQSNRSPTEKLVDTFARAYTPAIVGLAAILASVPWLWGTEIGRIWTLNALILIVIACPCALTISTPVTYAAGLAATAQRGIVCKGGATLEALGNIQTIVFDKTGTLTEGNFVVTNLQLIGNSHTRHEMLALLALMEIPSSHPLSTTLLQAVKSEGIEIPTSSSVKEHTLLPGEGVTAIIDEKRIFVGNRRLFERLVMYNDLPIECKHIAEQWEVEQGGTVGFIGIEGTGIIGSFAATDVVRSEAKETVQAFLSSGFNVVMLTGDCEGAAKSVARQVGLPESSIHSQLLPEDKLSFVAKLKSTKVYEGANDTPSINIFRREEKIVFCGDGVNDAPALAFADVGISMGEGAALAMEMSDVTLMDSNLSKLLYVVQVGSKVLQTIRENIMLSLLCKVIVISLTFGGYMTLLLAIASDVGVMLLVTLNGMKLLPRNSEAIVSMDSDNDEKRGKTKSPNRFRRVQRYERISTDVADTTDDNVEMV